MIEYQVYGPGHFESLRELFLKVWGALRSTEYDRKHWDQTLIGTAPAIVAITEDRIVGFYMVWPVLLTAGVEVVIGGQPIDSMVHKEFQGRGLLRELGSRCYQECARRSIAVMYGAPNRAALPGNVGGLNWCHVTEIVDYVRPIVGRRPSQGFLADLAAQDQTMEGLTVSVSDGMLDRIAAFCSDRAKAGDTRKVWRTASSPQWFRYRYGSTPDVRYVTLTLQRGGDDIQGTAVCGIRLKGDARSESVAKLTIGEVVGRDARADRELIAGTVRLAAMCGAPYVLAKSAGADLGFALLKAGFIPYRRTPLISRTLDASCHRANPLAKKGWALFGGAFDTI
jgi:GNAT superfamily N-acetyltransferase